MNAIAPTAAAARPIVANYSCDHGVSLKVVFSGNNATVTHARKTVTLSHGLAADGFLYSNRKYSLRGKGNEAIWTAGRARPVNCRVRS